jgi:hypothetical protein
MMTVAGLLLATCSLQWSPSPIASGSCADFSDKCHKYEFESNPGRARCADAYRLAPNNVYPPEPSSALIMPSQSVNLQARDCVCGYKTHIIAKDENLLHCTSCQWPFVMLALCCTSLAATASDNQRTERRTARSLVLRSTLKLR